MNTMIFRKHLGKCYYSLGMYYKIVNWLSIDYIIQYYNFNLFVMFHSILSITNKMQVTIKYWNDTDVVCVYKYIQLWKNALAFHPKKKPPHFRLWTQYFIFIQTPTTRSFYYC